MAQLRQVWQYSQSPEYVVPGMIRLHRGTTPYAPTGWDGNNAQILEAMEATPDSSDPSRGSDDRVRANGALKATLHDFKSRRAPTRPNEPNLTKIFD